MTLQQVQNIILEYAFWIGDLDDLSFRVDEFIKVDSRLRDDLLLNDEEIKAMFGTTDVVTVGDCMRLEPYDSNNDLPF